jgi:hypothetical protein
VGRNFKLERLQRGESFITSEKGNSMAPLIKSGQDHMLEPITWDKAEVGDIVYCKVKGNWYTHLVTAKNESRGCQISNNSGYVNGWTKAVYGVVTEVIGGNYKRKVKVMSKAEEIAQLIQDALGDKFGTVTPKLYDPNKMQQKVTVGILENIGDGKSLKRFSITIDDHFFDEKGNPKSI